MAYKTGQAIAKTDRSMAAAPAPIQAALRHGPRVVTTARNASEEHLKATAAQQRATKARQRASAAARAAARATQAHADAHPTSAGAFPVDNPQNATASGTESSTVAVPAPAK